MHLQRATDEELLTARAPGVSGEAFAEFYRRHERVVLAFHMRRVRDSHVAADLAATTFAEALAARGRFRSRGAGNATAWLFGIAGHVVSQHHRRAGADSRKAARLLHELPALTPEQSQEIEALSGDGPLLEALQLLPAEQRDAIHAYVIAGDSYDDIAARLETRPATVRKRVSRGLAALRSTTTTEDPE